MGSFWKQLTAPKILISAVIVLGAVLVWFLLRQVYNRYVDAQKVKGDRMTLMRVAFDVLRFALLACALLLVLQINGINVSSAVAGLGILSAIVGLALQDVLKDTIMGVHIMTDHFFAIGDVVRYGDMEGVVTDFNVKTTTLRNIYDQTITTVCNRNISQITRMPASIQVDIDLPLSYDEDFRHVHQVLTELCIQIGQLPGIDRCEYMGTQDFAGSAVLYRLRFFCPPTDRPQRNRDALRLIQEALAAAGLQIPYDQYDVHLIKP